MILQEILAKSWKHLNLISGTMAHLFLTNDNITITFSEANFKVYDSDSKKKLGFFSSIDQLMNYLEGKDLPKITQSDIKFITEPQIMKLHFISHNKPNDYFDLSMRLSVFEKAKEEAKNFKGTYDEKLNKFFELIKKEFDKRVSTLVVRHDTSKQKIPLNTIMTKASNETLEKFFKTGQYKYGMIVEPSK